MDEVLKPKKLTHNPIATSFILADGKNVIITKRTSTLFKDITQTNDIDGDDLIQELARKKRKLDNDLQSKKQKRTKPSPSIETSTGSINLTHSSPGTTDLEDDDVEWSDCDELEISRNISLLEQSMNQKSSPKRNGSVKNENDEELEWSDFE